ncbi:hypothetical protein NE865_11634 [Phthorimaea operculella]|nr:hypothetical protein NE865_11634 [Phthorimaea operculella]
MAAVNKSESKDASKSSRSRRSSQKKADLLELKKSLDELKEVLDDKEQLLRRKVAVLEDMAAASSTSSSTPSSRHITVSEASITAEEVGSEHARTREWARKHEDFFTESWATPVTAAKPPPQCKTNDGGGISPVDNIARLRLALKGEARAAVSACLYTCSDPGEVMSNLELRFGHPAKIVRDQIRVINALKPVSNDPVDLSKFSCKVSNCCASMSAISSEYEHSAQLFETIVMKLNSNLRSRWADYASRHADRGTSRLACLSEFLKHEAECALRYLPVVSGGHVGVSARSPSVPAAAPLAIRKYPIHTANAGKPKLCSFCSISDHNIVSCSKFIDLDIPDRRQWIKDNKKCYRCLLYQHLGKDCKFSKYLHRLLRLPKPAENVNQDESESANINTISQNVSSKLKVLPIQVTGPNGSRKLMHWGATISLIDQSLAQDIGAYNSNMPSETLTIRGIGSSCQTIKSTKVKVEIEGKTGRKFGLNLKTMLNLDLETQYLEKGKIVSYSHIKPVEHLIDWYAQATPKLLIGQDYWHLIVTKKLYEGKFNEPAVSETLLGHVVHGNGLSVRGSMLCNHISVESRSPDEELNSLVKQSYSLDSLGVVPKERNNPQIERALTILNNTTKRCDDTTWETGLLWEKDENEFPETGKYALKRLYSVEKSFKKDPTFAKAYEAQIQRLLDMNYAQLYDDSNRVSCASNRCRLAQRLTAAPLARTL